MRSPQDTIAAIITPLGESGVGVIRVSGANAIPIVKSLFHPAKEVDLNTAPSHTCYFGTLYDPGDLIDQVVVTVFRSPNSYTGDDVVEISAHGNPLILDRILQSCIAAGARLADPGEFTERAFIAGKIDLTQAEAVADLIRAKTDQARAAALGQLAGRLSNKVRALRDRLLPLLAHVEVGLDHSDEDHDFLSREQLAAGCEEVQRDIEDILASGRIGKILREGLRVALVGRPNVGKSSLLNALLKEDRAIVTPIPGTTRDTLEESVNWDGLPVVLTDTAGVHEAAGDAVERLGMERSRKALHAADLVLCVLDASEAMTKADYAILRECESKPHIQVMNKVDLMNPHPQPLSPTGRGATKPISSTILLEPLSRNGRGYRSPRRPGGEGGVRVSALTGEGLDDLIQAVKKIALGDTGSPSDARWLLNVRHQAALQKAQDALRHAAEAASQDAYEECVALELHGALTALGEIIGETATEDLLDQIFSKFCIGK